MKDEIKNLVAGYKTMVHELKFSGTQNIYGKCEEDGMSKAYQKVIRDLEKLIEE